MHRLLDHDIHPGPWGSLSLSPSDSEISMTLSSASWGRPGVLPEADIDALPPHLRARTRTRMRGGPEAYGDHREEHTTLQDMAAVAWAWTESRPASRGSVAVYSPLSIHSRSGGPCTCVGLGICCLSIFVWNIIQSRAEFGIPNSRLQTHGQQHRFWLSDVVDSQTICRGRTSCTSPSAMHMLRLLVVHVAAPFCWTSM